MISIKEAAMKFRTKHLYILALVLILLVLLIQGTSLTPSTADTHPTFDIQAAATTEQQLETDLAVVAHKHTQEHISDQRSSRPCSPHETNGVFVNHTFVGWSGCTLQSLRYPHSFKDPRRDTTCLDSFYRGQ